ncbi:MAG: ribosome biogenesis GTP-binding protein YihA/YsxC [bacterium]|nr:ribosome biogenesis GTP-binding protein YihA/YsxC [bacterium]
MPRFTIPTAEFVLSCPDVARAPRRPLPEIAFAGRSNVGKSSLINSLTQRKNLALTSRTPGKTRLLNYFLIGGDLGYFVDLPGYGYAKVGGDTLREWGRALENYLRDCPRLALVVVILDVRRGLTSLDEQMLDACLVYRRPWLAVITKSDKLAAQARNHAVNSLSGPLISRGARAVLPYSSLTHDGREIVWEQLLSAFRENS